MKKEEIKKKRKIIAKVFAWTNYIELKTEAKLDLILDILEEKVK